MTWTTIASIELSQDWQFTPEIPLELGYVRFTFPESIGAVIRVAQADLGSLNDLYDERRIVASTNNQIHEFIAPPFIVDRALALRVPNFAQSFTVQIEVSPMPVSRSGATQVTVNTPTSAAINATSVNASTASVQLLAANANRKGAAITNNSSATLFVELGSTASSNAYTIALGQGDMYELPLAYTGVISGIWTAANGNAMIREFV